MSTRNEIYMRLLEDARKSGEIVAVHKWDDDPSIFLCGLVTTLTDEGVTLQFVDPNGRPDEVDMVPYGEIVRLEFGTHYVRNLKHLHENFGKLPIPPSKKGRRVTLRKEVRERLSELVGAPKVIELNLEGEDRPVLGRILEYSHPILRFARIYDEFGPDGECLVGVDQIKWIAFDSATAVAATYLFT